MLDDGLAELASWGKQSRPVEDQEDADDFVALDDNADGARKITTEEQNAELRKEIEALRRVQRVSFEKLDRSNAQLKRQEKLAALNGAQNGAMDTSSDDD